MTLAGGLECDAFYMKSNARHCTIRAYHVNEPHAARSRSRYDTVRRALRVFNRYPWASFHEYLRVHLKMASRAQWGPGVENNSRFGVQAQSLTFRARTRHLVFVWLFISP